MPGDAPSGGEGDGFTRGDELRTFGLLAVVLAPALSVAIVGGYGFAIWMSQLIVGPPTG